MSPPFGQARNGGRSGWFFAGPFGGDEVWLHSAENVGEGRQQLV